MAGDFIQRSRHGTVFYFRRRVPLELRRRLGRQHFYVSLRTEELAKARRRAPVLAVATDRLFSELLYRGDSKDGLRRTDYNLKVEFDAQGRPQLNVTDAKEGEEASVEDLAKRLLGVATLAKPQVATSDTPTVAEAMAAVLADPGIEPSTAKEYRRAFEFFSRFVGAVTRLARRHPRGAVLGVCRPRASANRMGRQDAGLLHHLRAKAIHLLRVAEQRRAEDRHRGPQAKAGGSRWP